uniref:EFHB C-terminal EF-hand domain-containing protein n=1 Tax=Heliothis virescens TaxID=7102 RepID=A0A2A4JRC8_HELVI
MPSAQVNEHVSDALQHYLLKDEADALLCDTIFPTPKPRPLPPLRHPIPQDMRNSGPFGPVSRIINPPVPTKFQSLVEDFKETAYTSYWMKPIGGVRDPTPLLPEGFDSLATTFGKPIVHDGGIYDVIMPKNPLPDKTPPSKGPGAQVRRNYCSPPFDINHTYGFRTGVDKRGTYARCCITDDRILLGTAGRAIINSIQSNFSDAHQPKIGQVLAPNDNKSEVPKDYTFGILKPPDNLPECLTFCEVNKGVKFFRSSLKHLNTVRKGLSTRVLPSFFRSFYSKLKYYDKEKSGWLAKDIVYEFCGNNLIRFDTEMMEYLLTMWQAFDGFDIKYEFLVLILNYREPLPELPKIPDFPEDCLDFRTTYREMVKPGQVADTRLTAGLPSGRYFDADYPTTPDRFCKADEICLPQETDVKVCMNPSVLTLLFVTHRDMYQKREPNVVRRVFEAAIGKKFTDEKFNAFWEEAKQYHSEGWVCYETFRRVFDKYLDSSETEEKIETKT